MKKNTAQNIRVNIPAQKPTLLSLYGGTMGVQLRQASKAIVLAILLTVSFIPPFHLMTGTADAWEVHVWNTSDRDADVRVWRQWGEIGEHFVIAQGANHSWYTGAWCSSYLTGHVLNPDGTPGYTIPKAGCAGLYEQDGTGAGICCFDVHFKIQKGSDGAYHFVKY